VTLAAAIAEKHQAALFYPYFVLFGYFLVCYYAEFWGV
jgi:hypothetical protein